MSQERVFYDGDCGLCHRTVLFLLAHDRDGSLFRFAPLFGETFNAHVPAEARSGIADSVVVQTADGKLLQRAGGVFHLLRRIGGFWGWVGSVGGGFPSTWTDWGYDRVAAIRHRLFKRPPGACPIVPDELRSRFEP